MSDINQNVNINVNANTQDAGQDINKLENNIKTLDGAVNLVGGSVEVLAGALAITGAVSEENAEKFQSAAIGAIALADGSKRILEGYKTLATETKVLTTVQRIYNTVLKANPIFILLGVLTAVTLGVIAFTAAQNKGKTAAEKSAEALEKQEEALKALNAEQKLALELLSAQGASTEEVLEKQVENAKELLEAQGENLAKQREINQFSKETKQAIEDVTAAENDLLIAETKLATFRTNAAKTAAEDAAKTAAERKRENELSIIDTDKLAKKEISFQAERRDQSDLTLRKIDANQQKETEIAKNEGIKRGKIFQAEQEAKELLLTQGVDNLQGALGALFAENKAVASANVLIDAAQAGVGIIKNSQTTGPFAIAYQATQFALLTATTIASLRQINSAEPGSAGGTPNTPSGVGGLPTTGGIGGNNTGGRPLIANSSASGVTSINAVVLSGEVTSAQAQDAAIRNRRRFG